MRARKYPLLGSKAFAALFTVAVQGVEDDGIRFCRGANLDGFAFQQFVILKKPAQHDEAMRWHLRSLTVAVEFGVFRCHRDDLVISLAGIDHGHQADGAGMNDGQGYDRFLAKHKNIQWVVVFRQGLRNEPVIRGIVNGRVENAVEPDEAAGLVELIFHAGPVGNLDD